MFNRKGLVMRKAVAVLVTLPLSLAFQGYAQAENANESLSEGLTANTHITTTSPSDFRGHTDVIEEIVVTAKKNRQLPDLGSSLSPDPVVENPGQFDLRLLPTYDPEQTDRHLDLFQLNEELRRPGLVQLFRVRFGRRP